MTHRERLPHETMSHETSNKPSPTPQLSTTRPKTPSPRAARPSTRKHPTRRPPTLKESLSKTSLLFPPLPAPEPNLLPYLPSSQVVQARVSSTAFAHTTTIHIRSNTLLLYHNDDYEAVLPLPTHGISANKGVVTISAVGYSQFHIRPAQGSTGSLIKALRPPLPPVITILQRLSDRVYLARLKRRKVAVKLFRLDDLPDHAIALRAGLQRAQGIGIPPLLAAVQGRGYCGIVMPIYADLGAYIAKHGKLSGESGRGVVAHLVRGLCRAHRRGCEVGEFGKGDVLVHSKGVMVSRIGHASVLHGEGPNPGGEWKTTLSSLVSVVRECCEVDESGEDFVSGCEKAWSVEEMLAHSWIRKATTPRLRKIRVKGSKDISQVPRRIGSGGKGILGWEFCA